MGARGPSTEVQTGTVEPRPFGDRSIPSCSWKRRQFWTQRSLTSYPSSSPKVLKMSRSPTKSPIRFIVGIMLGAAAMLIAIAVWMIVNDKGAPVFVALAGAMLGAFAAVLASQSAKKPDA